MKEIKVFLASSIKDFCYTRRIISDFVNSLNNFYYMKRQSDQIYIRLYLCENMSAAVYKGKKQEEYNEVIRKCDYFMMLVSERLGEFTREEFDVAKESCEKNGFPIMYTFFKDGITPTNENYIKLQEELDEKCKYYFSSEEELKLGFLSMILKNNDLDWNMTLDGDLLKIDKSPFMKISVKEMQSFAAIKEKAVPVVSTDKLLDLNAMPDSRPRVYRIDASCCTQSGDYDIEYFGDMIRNSNDIYRDLGIYFYLVTRNYSEESSLDIENCKQYYFLYNNLAPKAMLEDFETVYNTYLQIQSPNIITFRKDTVDLLGAFDKLLSGKNHFWTQYHGVSDIEISLLKEVITPQIMSMANKNISPKSAADGILKKIPEILFKRIIQTNLQLLEHEGDFSEIDIRKRNSTRYVYIDGVGYEIEEDNMIYQDGNVFSVFDILKWDFFLEWAKDIYGLLRADYEEWSEEELVAFDQISHEDFYNEILPGGFEEFREKNNVDYDENQLTFIDVIYIMYKCIEVSKHPLLKNCTQNMAHWLNACLNENRAELVKAVPDGFHLLKEIDFDCEIGQEYLYELTRAFLKVMGIETRNAIAEL